MKILKHRNQAPPKSKSAKTGGKKNAATAETPRQGIWSGTVSFSLVAIPVRLVKAIEPGRVNFRMLHETDHAPLQRKMFCAEDEKIVAPQEIIRGFEISPGKHVLLSDEELESVSPDRSRTIEIAEFVDTKEVAPIFYDHPYFLVPLKGGEKSYRLLAEVLKRTNKVGIAKFVLGEREYLVEIKSRDNVLVLNTLHYSEEIMDDAEFSPKESADADEINAMKKSIAKRMSDFAPNKYSDARRDKINEILKKIAKERKPVEAPAIEEEAPEGSEDLVAALEESMRRMRA